MALPETAIDLRHVRYMHVRPNYSTFNIYYRPDVLMPGRAQRLIKGENFRVWITVQVEPGTRSGYTAARLRSGLTIRLSPCRSACECCRFTC